MSDEIILRDSLFKFLRPPNYVTDVNYYLPNYLAEDEAFSETQRVLSWEHERYRLKVIDFAKQLHPQTATWGLSVWEEEYGLSTPANTDLELRRAIVMAKILGTAPMTVANTNKLINLFTEKGTGYVDELPAPGVLRIVLPQQNVFYEELIDALNTYMPSHLLFNIDFVMKLDWSGEDGIRFGITNALIGTKRIGLESPADANIDFELFSLLSNGHGGKIGVDAHEDIRNVIGRADIFAHHSRQIISANVDDVPLWMRSLSEPSTVTTGVGFGDLSRRHEIINLSAPETVNFTLGAAFADNRISHASIGVSNLDDVTAKNFYGTVALRSGNITIKEDRDDLPPWQRNPNTTPQIGYAVGLATEIQHMTTIGVDGDESAGSSILFGSANHVNGKRIIGAGDVPDYLKKLARSFVTPWLTFSTPARRTQKIFLQTPETLSSSLKVGQKVSDFNRRTVGISSTENANSKLGYGTVNFHGGRQVIGADLSDLDTEIIVTPVTKKKRILPHAGLIHLGTMAVR